MKKVIIIGAGYGGIALANILAKKGHEVHVYEKNAMPGGRVGSFKDEGFTFDTGPSWYLMPEVFEQYYSLFGKNPQDELDLQRLTPGYTVFFEHDAPITIQGDLARDSETFEAIEHGAGLALRTYVEKSSLVYTLALRHFLYSNFSRLVELVKTEIIAHAVSMLRLVMQPLDSYVSKHFSDQRLKQILEYHMVFLGSSPFQAPALYSLMSTLDFQSGVFYPKRGMYSLVESLADLGEPYNVTYHYKSDVTSITVTNGQATGIQLAGGETVTADIVVSNADLHHTETRLVPHEYSSYPESYWQKRQPGPSALLIFMGVKGELPMLTHHTLLFVDAWKENFTAIYEKGTLPQPASLYICNPSKSDPSLAPKGHENLFVLVPLPADVHIDDDILEDLADEYVEQIGRTIGVDDFKSRISYRACYGPDDFEIDYNSWLGGALGGQSHVLKQSAIFRTPNKSKKVRNLYYVGAGTTPGIGLPMCLISAQLVAKRILGDKRGGPLRPEQLEEEQRDA
jgi:phytoene desaturase